MSNINKDTRIIDLTVGQQDELLNKHFERIEKAFMQSAGLVFLTEEEAVKYTGYSARHLYNFRQKEILHNYGERKTPKYLKRELDALLQVKKRA